eukprot:gb/GEZN01011994.1/.p1 GENE.gb/GEZN01011994.1/~~gb/GEZN01011994.1/.p1  ORF type:complete len:335 (+),score=15.35 gb/GEZN01011994.1/:71-1075(+)
MAFATFLSCLFTMLSIASSQSQPSVVGKGGCFRPAYSNLRTTATSRHVLVMVATRSQGYLHYALELMHYLWQTNFTTDVVLIAEGANITEMISPCFKLPSNFILLDAFELLKPRQNLPKMMCTSSWDSDWTLPKRQKGLMGYYMKMTIFSTFFRKWERVLYIDAHCHILHPEALSYFFTHIDSSGLILANPNGFPECPPDWKLGFNFFKNCDRNVAQNLSRSFDLDVKEFQSAVMLFDTAIIHDDTVEQLTDLWHRYSQIVSGDQPVLNLYFLNMRKVYKPLPFFLGKSGLISYDNRIRDPQHTKKYIVVSHRPHTWKRDSDWARDLPQPCWHH